MRNEVLRTAQDVFTPVDSVIGDLFNQPLRFEAWAWHIPEFTKVVLNAISEDADISRIFASGSLVRALQQKNIRGHNDISSRMYYPTQLDAADWLAPLDPLQQQAVSALYCGQYDTDWRLVLHPDNANKVFKRIAQRICKRTSGFSVTIHNEQIDLDTGLPCLTITFEEEGRRIKQQYRVDITPVPTGTQLAADWRMGPHQSRRMAQFVQVIRDEAGQFCFAESLDKYKTGRAQINEPEYIEDPRYQTLAQAVFPGLRLILGNIDAETSLDRAAYSDIPIEELIDWETIIKYRAELRRHLALFRQGKQELPGSFRIEDVMREGMLITMKNPIRATLLLCALGIIDVFIPECRTLDYDYDIRVNSMAQEIINRLTWPADTPAFPQPRAYLGSLFGDGPGRTGFAFFLEALDALGLIPWWQTPMPEEFRPAKRLKNPFAGVALFDLRRAELRY